MKLIPQQQSYTVSYAATIFMNHFQTSNRMFLSNYRKIYATTSVGFQYLRSVVDKYAEKSILDTSMYLKCMYLRNVP
jgi:menaquinone-dependent protoporphyrinogen IX oxidase